MATVLEKCTAIEERSAVYFCGQKDSMHMILINKYSMFMGGNICEVKFYITGSRNVTNVSMMANRLERRCASVWDNSQNATRRYIQGDRTLHNHRCENLRSYTALYPRRQNSSKPPLWEPQILHGVISQKIELFITTAVRTSDPTIINIKENINLHNHLLLKLI
jgi:hypothetical protein